ncbi:hypothetical protein MTR67_035150 [Solanum verrucosum]|uniref:Uncharacterized protein n=1 Tax=Solanum verrucosum TaxID=315347 RepID=A0AAF0ZL83_SOLVR|nr:hypothetical protein MTR67_035150 [Solanum verrucosum]
MLPYKHQMQAKQVNATLHSLFVLPSYITFCYKAFTVESLCEINLKLLDECLTLERGKENGWVARHHFLQDLMLFYWLGGKASLFTRFDAILLVGWRDITSCKALCERIFNKGGGITEDN